LTVLLCCDGWQSPVQQDVDRQVLELVEKELPDIKACHAHRVSCILEDTRKQLKEYLKAGQVLRGELYRPLQWSEIASESFALRLFDAVMKD
jgi:hypothetical protein